MHRTASQQCPHNVFYDFARKPIPDPWQKYLRVKLQTKQGDEAEPICFEIFCVIGEWNMCILTKCIIGWLPMFIRYQSINCLQLQNTENQFGG